MTTWTSLGEGARGSRFILWGKSRQRRRTLRCRSLDEKAVGLQAREFPSDEESSACVEAHETTALHVGASGRRDRRADSPRFEEEPHDGASQPMPHVTNSDALLRLGRRAKRCRTGGIHNLPNPTPPERQHRFFPGTSLAGMATTTALLCTSILLLPRMGSPIMAPIDGRDDDRHIGDGVRAASSASSFFSSVDRDGDGMIREAEVATFVRDRIGESEFDTAYEVDSEVHSIMESLDRDHDDGLDRNDMYAYWLKVESLLTADEVAEWVVHAVQLPEYVGRIFRDNVVTGYDFPELVENDGEALLNELGIEKASFRKKLVRHINARMLGLGDVPAAPSNARHAVESCSTVSFSWRKSDARGFPVHSYRVQRRSVGMGWTNGSNNNGFCANEERFPGDSASSPLAPAGESCQNDAALVANPAGDEMTVIQSVGDGGVGPESTATAGPAARAPHWTTVYTGADMEFVDNELRLGHTYVYRIQAWNSVGRSEWATIDITKSLKKQGCGLHKTLRMLDRAPSFMQRSSSVIWGSYHVAGVLALLVRCVVTLAATAAAVMRFRRASARSTASLNMVPIFPWLWKLVNMLSFRALGVEVVPSSMLGDGKEWREQANEHDETVGATRLNGYKKTTSGPLPAETDASGPFSRRVMFQNKSISTGNMGILPGVRENTARSGTSSKRGQPDKVSPNAKTDAKLTSEGSTDSTDDEKAKVDLNKESALAQSTRSTDGASDEDNTDEYFDDHRRCNSCRKKFRVGRRWKHHCSRCLSTFCHKHGRTTHSHLTSCRMPGSCVCLPCLKSEELVRQLREEAHQKNGGDVSQSEH